MNRSHITSEISKMLPDKKEAKELVAKVFGLITDALKKNEKVVISNFGTFKIKVTKEREYRNPQTGDKLTLPSRKSVKFKPSKNIL